MSYTKADRINPRTGKRIGWEQEQAEAKAQSLDAVKKEIALLERQQRALEARTRFMPFVRFTSPDPEDPNNVNASKYKNARHHDAIARVLEEVVAGNIRFLILTMPPRHGKSELVSRRLPAWLIGRFPDQHGVVATYSDDFAAEFGKEVRTIIKMPQFRQVFPGVELMRGGAASDKLQTTKGGQWSFVGRGGGLTGRGAHCFPSGTRVETLRGRVGIEELTTTDKVLSYDIRSDKPVWRSVQAVARRPSARLFRITTAAGRVVEATGDHPFFVDGRWVEARLLTPGDRLLCAVRKDDAQAGVRDQQERAARAEGVLLLQRLLGALDELKATWRANLRQMQGSRTAAGVFRSCASWSHILFARVHDAGTRGRVRAAGAGAYAPVRTLQRDVHADERDTSVLWARLRGSGARGADAWGEQSALARRGVGQPSETPRNEAVQGDATSRHASGWAALRSVRGHGGLGSSSHRRKPAEQQGGEPRDAMSSLSHADAFFGRENDFVRTVEDTRRDADVYDIQVQETHCFFAEGVLSHNCLIIDDLIKDDKEAQSQAIRDQAWNWFTKVAMSRRMGKKLVILTFTRWHADDPIGRLTDPENPHYRRELAEQIKIINLPAIAEEDDPLGRKVGEALWPDGPDRFDLDFLREQQLLDPLGFAALYQQRPSLLDGDLFKRENIRLYRQSELPENLRFYCASDHAVATGQRNDFTVLLKIGVDEANNIYLIDCFWQKAKSDVVVEAMLNMGRGDKKPLLWWAEKGHISKSIGPFLHKRMAETNTYMNVREVTPVGDKAQRAQSMVGRVAMGKVYFPAEASWTEKAINQMMAFPNGTHDDFVDALSLVGLGLQSQFAPAAIRDKKADLPKTMTLGWVKLADKWAADKATRAKVGGF